MNSRQWIVALCTAMVAVASNARADDVLKVAVPQRGAWDAGLAELSEALAQKFITAPLSADQVKQLVQIDAVAK